VTTLVIDEPVLQLLLGVDDVNDKIKQVKQVHLGIH
jgi:hypothetical protein